MEGDRVNFLHWRVNAAVGSSMPMPRRSASASEDPSATLTGHRTAYFGGKDGATEVPVYDGMQLEPGHVVRGAAVIEEPTTSVTVLPGHAVRVSLSGYDYRVNGDAL